MATRFSEASDVEHLDAMHCDLCIFGSGTGALAALGGLRLALPRGAHVIVIDDSGTRAANHDRESPPGATGKTAPFIRLRAWLWQLQTGGSISLRQSCRVTSCDKFLTPNGGFEMVVRYRAAWDPFRPRALRAKRVIRMMGFGPNG